MAGKILDRLSRLLHINRSLLSKYVFVYVSILPVIGVYAFLRIIPIVENFVYSFFNSAIGNPMKSFAGLQNFIELFSDQLFLVSLRNTTYFALFVTLFGVLIAVLVAALLSDNSRSGAFFETVYFLPVITPMVPVAVVWKWIYDPTYGLLNYVLSVFGIDPVAWLVYPNTAMFAIIVMSVWKIIGYNMVIFLVGIRDIPPLLHRSGAYRRCGQTAGLQDDHSALAATDNALRDRDHYN